MACEHTTEERGDTTAQILCSTARCEARDKKTRVISLQRSVFAIVLAFLSFVQPTKALINHKFECGTFCNSFCDSQYPVNARAPLTMRDSSSSCHTACYAYACIAPRKFASLQKVHEMIPNTPTRPREAPFAFTRYNLPLYNGVDLSIQTNLIMFINSSLSKISNRIYSNMHESRNQVDRGGKRSGLLGSLTHIRAVIASNRSRLPKPLTRQISHGSRTPDSPRALFIFTNFVRGTSSCVVERCPGLTQGMPKRPTQEPHSMSKCIAINFKP
mmetsp:Transcript_103341/g.178081  ORF Transcript_103341/g.178081 Transcript_103341/m.178081 type:complete len:272 (+) Transcript_103341:368-1183(+)